MSYADQCEDAQFVCIELLRFSTPGQTYRGDPTGVAGRSRSAELNGPADAVRTLNLTRETVASFRAKPVTGPHVTLSFDADTYTANDGGSAASVTVRLSSLALGRYG